MITYLSFTDIAERTGRSSGSLRQLRLAGRFPEPDAMVGKAPGWLPATIDDWTFQRLSSSGTNAVE